MKFKPLALLLLIVAIFTCCIFHKKKDYIIPETVPVELRDEMINTVERGKTLYKLNCTGCHGIFAKGKDGVPDFSEQQIHKYSERFIMSDPTNHAVAFKMDPGQLQDILTYLRFRIVKNGGKDIPGGL